MTDMPDKQRKSSKAKNTVAVIVIGIVLVLVGITVLGTILISTGAVKPSTNSAAENQGPNPDCIPAPQWYLQGLADSLNVDGTLSSAYFVETDEVDPLSNSDDRVWFVAAKLDSPQATNGDVALWVTNTPPDGPEDFHLTIGINNSYSDLGADWPTPPATGGEDAATVALTCARGDG